MSEFGPSEAPRPALTPEESAVEKPTAEEFWARVERRARESGAYSPAELIVEFRDADRRG